MDAGEFVVSAGRAVLDMVEREWQPLSGAELEQRLDQAVEELLEAELMARLPAEPPPGVYVQVLRGGEEVQPQVLQFSLEEEEVEEEEEEEPPVRDPEPTGTEAAVQHITDLLQCSQARTRPGGRPRLSLSQTVRLSLTLLTERVSYRCVSQRFHLEKGNIYRIFFSFCERVNALEETLIRWPAGLDTLVPLATLGPEQRGLPGVLGVLGHTRIPIRLPTGRVEEDGAAPEEKRMKKEVHPDSWLNLELLVDHHGRFLHCRISRGSYVDRGRALRAKLQQDPGLVPSGSCIVARTGYPLSAHILTPYSGALGPREELFNRTLEEHLHILDQAFARLRARFCRLQYLDIGDYDRARAVVLTACVLHNVFLDLGQVVEGEVEGGGATREEEGAGVKEEEEEDEGLNRRDAISKLLFKT
ncbi:uncharacterized protein [Antennarius striatus]|uniref:uncharacterized protein n=1 Tax=Antennarius striatus TaxID=241820 RepID=UPI0035AFD05C